MAGMRYLIDGYNVTMTDPATAGLPAAEQRAGLVRRLSARGAELLGGGTITVVFDGRPDGTTVARGQVGVRFSADDEADDVIAGLATGPDVTVVTSDSALTRRVTAEGARVLPSATVFEAARPARRRTKGRYPAASAGLPRGANRITEELKSIWLTGEDEE